jgi:hypothetical protein
MLDEGVVAEPRDIDLGMITGAGWPFHMGGITPYLDRTGISERVTGRRFLAVGVASVPGTVIVSRETAGTGASPDREVVGPPTRPNRRQS